MPVAVLPRIIQGGMGVGVSSWQLARAVAQSGQLGVVSGTALDTVLVRRLQDGDPDGDVRRALSHFPNQAMAERALTRYFRPDGRPAGTPYASSPKLSLTPTRAVQELSLLGNFVEVWLAKEGHQGLVGINFLEKIQMATPSAALGAMLAGVDYVLMGAGVPREIPRLLNDYAAGEVGRLSIDVHGSEQAHTLILDPAELMGADLPALRRPKFLAIISADVLASYLVRDAAIRPDGFVIEGPLAGGHNAPPRGQLRLDEAGEPIYGVRDEVNLGKITALGLPFWLAGAYGRPEQLAAALAAGASGIQVGTLFALSRESGINEGLRRQLLAELTVGRGAVRCDPLASPTGFPFKVAQLPGTLSEAAVYGARPRLCDLSYLRVPFLHEDGRIGYRCPSEPVNEYLRKGGTAAETAGRACLCNALMANVGLGQTRRDGYVEMPLVTLGSDLEGVRRLHSRHGDGWSATEVVTWLLGATSL